MLVCIGGEETFQIAAINVCSVRSWYVTLTGDVLASPEFEISTGDSVFGNMTKIGPTSWFIGGSSSQTGASTWLNVSRPFLATQPWAYT